MSSTTIQRQTEVLFNNLHLFALIFSCHSLSFYIFYCLKILSNLFAKTLQCAAMSGKKLLHLRSFDLLSGRARGANMRIMSCVQVSLILMWVFLLYFLFLSYFLIFLKSKHYFGTLFWLNSTFPPQNAPHYDNHQYKIVLWCTAY